MAKTSKIQGDGAKAWGAGRVAFTAHRSAILAKLAENWPVAAVYAGYRDKLGIGYRQFCRLVAAERKQEELGGGSKREMPPKPILSRPKPARVEMASSEPGERSFHFDPAAINDKDLI